MPLFAPARTARADAIPAMPIHGRLALQAHDGVGGGGDLVERRPWKAAPEDGFQVLTIDHDALPELGNYFPRLWTFR